MDSSVFLTLPITRFSLKLPSPEISLLSLFGFSSYLLLVSSQCPLKVSLSPFVFSWRLTHCEPLKAQTIPYSFPRTQHDVLPIPLRVPSWVLSSCCLSFPPAIVYLSVTPKLMSFFQVSHLSIESGNPSDSSVSPSAHAACINGTLIYPCAHTSLSPLSPLISLLLLSIQFSLLVMCKVHFLSILMILLFTRLLLWATVCSLKAHLGVSKIAQCLASLLHSSKMNE